MDSSQKTSRVHVALILGALLAGVIVARFVPERMPLAAYVPHTQFIPTDAVFKHAAVKNTSRDASHDLTGVEVDTLRLAMLGRIS